jgi:hypothetical protein
MSPQWLPSDDEEAAALRTAMEFQRRVAPIISFRLRPEVTSGINEFLHLINEPGMTEKLDAWDRKGGRWRRRLTSGISEHVRQTLTISAYHCMKLKEMDDSVVAALQGMPLAANEIIAGGDTTAMDAEYQAFILACRRCLDQLTYALAACFKQEYDSFRGLAKDFLPMQHNHTLAGALAIIYNHHEANFRGWLYSRTEERSLRDRIAHRSSIRVGTLNVSSAGVIFVGADVPDSSFEGKRISNVTFGLFNFLQRSVNDFVDCASSEFLRKLNI